MICRVNWPFKQLLVLFKDVLRNKLLAKTSLWHVACCRGWMISSSDKFPPVYLLNTWFSPQLFLLYMSTPNHSIAFFFSPSTPHSASLASLCPLSSHLLLWICLIVSLCMPFCPSFCNFPTLASPTFSLIHNLILCPSICGSALSLHSVFLPSSCAPCQPLPPSPFLLQACKPNHSAEGGGSGQSLPPHVGSLGQAEDQSCPAKRRRASSPSKVIMTLTASFSYLSRVSPTIAQAWQATRLTSGQTFYLSICQILFFLLTHGAF